MKKIAGATLLFAALIFLSFNKHSHDEFRTYHSVIWADGAGYYTYNPIWFIYGNQAEKFPPGIEKETGTGFHLDTASGKVITKYTSGVAMLQIPFFLSAHLLAPLIGDAPDGFSPVYHQAIWVAGVVYGMLGLYFSFLFLSHYFSKPISLITVSVFFLSTNLYYYMIDAAGMLHVYSYFLFSALSYLTIRAKLDPKFKFILPLFMALSLAILIRPINVGLLLVLLFLNPKTISAHSSSFSFLNKHKMSIIAAGLISFLVFIPQLIYWSQSFGSAIAYSYRDEGFSYLLSPRIAQVWFSPNNGLFTYAPVLILSVIGLVILAIKKERNAILIGTLFLLTSYLLSSWWNYWFGCSFGARGFVEHYVFLMYPFAWLLGSFRSMGPKIMAGGFILFCIWLNFDFIYYYDGCFYGGDWDWNTYFNLITD